MTGRSARFALALAGLACAVALGCPSTPQEVETEAVWLEGVHFRWALFNHRLSYLHLEATDDGVNFGFVGGNSTTGVEANHGAPCTNDDCAEIPAFDQAEVRLRRVHAVTSDVMLATADAEFMVGADGVIQPLTVALPATAEAGSQAIAIIAGWGVDSAVPLMDGDPACYRPESGWHPSGLAIDLDNVGVNPEGDGVDVDIAARFQAGEALEEIRRCIDEVNERAQLSMWVRVLVAVGSGTPSSEEVSYEAAWECGDCPFSPNEQPDPDPSTRQIGLSMEQAIVGWSSFGFAFNQLDPDGRGAYLRQVDIEIDAEGGTANGHANAYSPATQLSDFDYRFSGRISALPTTGTIHRSVIEADDLAAADEAGVPLLHALPTP